MIRKMFVEKYRPKTISEMVGSENLKTLSESIRADPWLLPHLLLATKSAGTGKTTLAKAIINETGADFLYLNASDERGIDVIRDRVKEFVITQGFNRNVPKIVHLDEADGLTRDAQDSLRNLMEEYSENCRFILTCNNENRIIEPIKSRCTVINLTNPPKEQIYDYLKNIIDTEKIELNISLNDVVNRYYPDIRSMLMALESIKVLGTIQINGSVEVANDVYDLLKKKKFTDARSLWLSSNVSHRDIVKRIYLLVMEDENVSKSEKYDAVSIIAEADYRMAIGSDAEITLAYLAFELVSILK
jgi:DNA polymerase III delta prime subunit